MAHEFDPGAVDDPFATLVRDYPGDDVYPVDDFRVEWGPVFHRGRLDGSARVLVVGQDPAAHESIARRILVGEAGQRVQGFLARLGIETSYVMINTFLYSVYGWGGSSRWDDEGIVEYRHRWLDAVLGDGRVEAVVTFGSLAARAFDLWHTADAGVAVANCIHPTYPESFSRGNAEKYAEAMARMLANWNEGLAGLDGSITPDNPRAPVPYASALVPDDLAPIPERDLPAGLPSWMRSLSAWAVRDGDTEDLKRATIAVRVPTAERPWLAPPE